MKIKRFRFLVVCAALAISVLVLIRVLEQRTNRVTVLKSTPKHQIVHIGDYRNAEAGERAAIQILSAQLKSHPKTTIFEVHWRDERDAYLTYHRENRSLLHRAKDGVVTKSQFLWRPPFYGTATTFYEPAILNAGNNTVTPETRIHRAARYKLLLRDFQKH